MTGTSFEQNAILIGLDDAEKRAIIEAGKLVDLGLRHKIYDAEKPITEVYFPLDCVLSVVTQMSDGQQIEVGTIGREGMSAIPMLLGASTTANDSYCQVPGKAVTIDAALFGAMLESSTKLSRLLDRYLQAYLNMLGQLAACNRLHSVYERCSRWLLLTHDRVQTDVILLTHEYLAMMLGTGRSGVTIAVGTLQQAGFIRSSQGTITIIDRAGLENASCECYDVARRQFAGLLRAVTRLP